MEVFNMASPTPVGGSVDITRVREFSDRVHVEAQQMMSRLKGKSEIRYFTGKDMAYDGLGTIEAVAAPDRFARLEFADLEHTRRQILPMRFQCVLPIEGQDQMEALFDFENHYEKHVAAAMMRQYDRVGITALTADIRTGENFETVVTAADDGVVTVDATAGLTYDRLLEIDEEFINQDLGIDMDLSMKCLALSGKEHTSLMREERLTSGDYSRDYFVEKGRIQRAAGFELVKYAAGAEIPTLVEDPLAGTRRCVAWTENALVYGMHSDFKIEVRQLDEYLDTTAVIIQGRFGAVRTEGSRVVQVDTAI